MEPSITKNSETTIKMKEEKVGFNPPAQLNPTAPVGGYVTPSETKPKPVRITIKDMDGHDVFVPYAPNPSCKKCFGRGYIGKNVVNGELIPCHKCYPRHRGSR